MSLNVRYEKKDKDIYYGISGPRNCLHCSAHLHRELELVLYRAGETVAAADSRRYDLKPGDLFLTFPNQIHSYETAVKEDYSIMILKPDLIPELSDELELSVPESAVVAGGAFDPRINSLFDAIVAICRQPEEAVPYRTDRRSAGRFRGVAVDYFLLHAALHGRSVALGSVGQAWAEPLLHLASVQSETGDAV